MNSLLIIRHLIHFAFYVFIFMATPALSQSSGEESSLNSKSVSSEDTQVVSLISFIKGSLNEMGLPNSKQILGLTDTDDIILEEVEGFSSENTVYKFNNGKRRFTVGLLRSENTNSPLLVLNVKDTSLQNIIPGLEKTPLGLLGSLPDITFIYSAVDIKEHNYLKSDTGKIAQNLGFFDGQIALNQGMNFISEVEVAGLSPQLKKIFFSLGVTDNYKMPIQGKVGDNIFKDTFSKGLARSGNSLLVSREGMSNSIQKLINNYGENFISSIDIKGDLPKKVSTSGISFDDGHFFIKGTAENKINFGVLSRKAKSFDLEIDNFLDLLNKNNIVLKSLFIK